MNLIKAEIIRYFSRRFLIVMLISLMGAFGFTVFTVMASSEKPSEQRWADAQQQAAQDRIYFEGEYNLCLKSFPDGKRCQDLHPSRVQPEDYLYDSFSFRRSIGGLVYFLAAFLSLFAFLVTASFIGSELHSGGITNLLLWRPERRAVLGTKLGVALAATAAIAVPFSVLYVGTFYGIARWTGWVGYLPETFWGDLTQTCLRGVGLALLSSLIAFAVATIGRHTAAALGALMGYVVVWEGGARLILSLVDRTTSDDSWFLSTHVAAWMADGYWYYLNSLRHHLAWWESGMVLGGIGVALTVFAFSLFQRRDLA
jgi:ABC-type transport system involved in multi-copper enzyme maturation permease subunit